MSADRDHEDRGISPVAGRPQASKLKRMVFGTVGVGVVAAAVVMARTGGKQEKPTQDKQPQMIAQPASFPTAPMQTIFTQQAPPPAAAPAPQAAPPQTLKDMVRDVVRENSSGDAAAPRMQSYTRAARVEKEPAAQQGAGTAPAMKSTPAGLDFKTGRVPGVKAGPALDMTYLMTPGVIRCALDNAIDTTQPGPIFCHTTEAVKSRANITLMEAGTQIVGSYSSGIQQGQSRLPAVSAFAITPNGVPVALATTMGDGLGRAGIGGEVDTHFGARFGGALLLMASQGAISIAQSALRSGSNNFNIQTGSMESAVSETLRNTVNIPPTIRVNAGTEIGLLLTVPVDFSDAYELRTAR